LSQRLTIWGTEVNLLQLAVNQDLNRLKSLRELSRDLMDVVESLGLIFMVQSGPFFLLKQSKAKTKQKNELL